MMTNTMMTSLFGSSKRLTPSCPR